MLYDRVILDVVAFYLNLHVFIAACVTFHNLAGWKKKQTNKKKETKTFPTQKPYDVNNQPQENFVNSY